MATFATKGPNRVPRILFFIAGMVPTDEQKDDISRFGPNASFRNADQVGSIAMSPLEECDAVAGPAIPERYANVYPNVSDVDFGGRLPRLSDFDRLHGPVHSQDNEAARAAKPPSFGADRIAAQGADRPAGAITIAGGGFVAPQPGNPDNLRAFGSERAENGPEGTNREGAQGSQFNPHRLGDSGVSLVPAGGATGAVAGPVSESNGLAGFTAPKPAEDEEGATGSTGGAKGRKAKGDSGASGSTGDSGASGSSGATA